MPLDSYTFEAGCHCGAIGSTFRASQAPESWVVRACRCSFCRAHGARTISDPDGSITFHIADAAQLQRYRFGAGSADFVVCRRCGVYLAAVLTSSRGQFATLNINTLRPPVHALEALPVSYEGESAEQRKRRREQHWTPVTDPS